MKKVQGIDDEYNSALLVKWIGEYSMLETNERSRVN